NGLSEKGAVPLFRGLSLSKRGTAPLSVLLADVQSLDEIRIPLRVLAFEVVEQPPALADQHQQAAARMMIFCVGFEVLGEVIDPFAQNRDLHFRGSGVAFVRAVAANQLCLAVFG